MKWILIYCVVIGWGGCFDGRMYQAQFETREFCMNAAKLLIQDFKGGTAICVQRRKP